MQKLRLTKAPTYLLAGIALLVLIVLGAAGSQIFKTGQPNSVSETSLFQEITTLPTSACTGELTPPMTEGPYHKAGSPERKSLAEPGVAGTNLTLTGYVFNRNCQPIAHAWLDFWQADGNGVYDNDGYRLRGHQYTNELGQYSLETVIPGEYPGRTPHIHVKVQGAPNKPVLTTQLFFPDQPHNLSDPIFNESLIVKLDSTSGGMLAMFSFVLDVE